MQTFTYTALNPKTGEKIAADVEADTEGAAARLLTERGLAPLEIALKKEKTAGGGFFQRVRPKSRVIFSRQMSTLINAGLPLVQSLRTVSGQTKNKTLSNIISQVIIDIEAGSTLADALAKYPEVFDDVYVSLIAAGETSGTLDKSLERLADQQEKDADVVSKVRGAMIYPSLVLTVLFAVVIFMMTTILPQVQSLYKSLPNAKLPFVTVILLHVANLIIHFWWLIIIVLIVLVVFGFRYLRTAAGSRILDTVKLKTWPIKELFSKLYMARFTRASETLVASGVPLLKMLQTAGRAIGNSHLEDSIAKAAEQVKGGKSLADSLRSEPYILPLVPDMIHIGEQSGALESMMSKLADYYEKEVDNQIKSISTIIEPLMMIIVGILALFVVAAVLLPIYNLAGKNLLNPGGGFH